MPRPQSNITVLLHLASPRVSTGPRSSKGPLGPPLSIAARSGRLEAMATKKRPWQKIRLGPWRARESLSCVRLCGCSWTLVATLAKSRPGPATPSFLFCCWILDSGFWQVVGSRQEFAGIPGQPLETNSRHERQQGASRQVPLPDPVLRRGKEGSLPLRCLRRQLAVETLLPLVRPAACLRRSRCQTRALRGRQAPCCRPYRAVSGT